VNRFERRKTAATAHPPDGTSSIVLHTSPTDVSAAQMAILLALLANAARLAKSLPGATEDVHVIVEMNGARACGSIAPRSTDDASGPIKFRRGGCSGDGAASA
jgi:hypothetical protein